MAGTSRIGTGGGSIESLLSPLSTLAVYGKYRVILSRIPPEVPARFGIISDLMLSNHGVQHSAKAYEHVCRKLSVEEGADSTNA